MKLSELEIDERFIAASAKDKVKADRYKVTEKPVFIRQHGRHIVYCFNENKRIREAKSSDMEVIKLPFKKLNNDTAS